MSKKNLKSLIKKNSTGINKSTKNKEETMKCFLAKESLLFHWRMRTQRYLYE